MFLCEVLFVLVCKCVFLRVGSFMEGEYPNPSSLTLIVMYSYNDLLVIIIDLDLNPRHGLLSSNLKWSEKYP